MLAHRACYPSRKGDGRPRTAGQVVCYIAPRPDPIPELTSREREILALLAEGYTNNAIAEQLVLSPKTVRNQISTIYDKLQVADRAQAIIRARDRGLG